MDTHLFEQLYGKYREDGILPPHLCYQELVLHGLALIYDGPHPRSRIGIDRKVGWENIDGTCLGQHATRQFKWED